MNKEIRQRKKRERDLQRYIERKNGETDREMGRETERQRKK